MTVYKSVFYGMVAFFIFFMAAGAIAQSASDGSDNSDVTFENMDDSEMTYEESEPVYEPVQSRTGDEGFIYPSRFYLGISPYYAIEDFDHDDTLIYETNPEFDDTFGGGIKFGYSFYETIDAIIVSLQSELAYFHQFEWESETVTAEMSVAALTGSFKVALAWRFSPFVETGVGLMYSEAEISESNMDYDDDEIDLCTRFGIGMDFFFNRHVALEVSAAYLNGLNDMDNVNFFTLGAGVNFYF